MPESAFVAVSGLWHPQHVMQWTPVQGLYQVGYERQGFRRQNGSVLLRHWGQDAHAPQAAAGRHACACMHAGLRWMSVMMMMMIMTMMIEMTTMAMVIKVMMMMMVSVEEMWGLHAGHTPWV